MKWVLSFILFLAIASRQAQGTNYWMRSDGTAATLAAAVGPETVPANCISDLTLESLSGDGNVPVRDDVIYISDKGGPYGHCLNVPSGGSLNHPITYRNVVGESPTFDASGHPTLAQVVLITKNYITIDGLTIIGGDMYPILVNPNVLGCVISNTSINSMYAPNYGIFVSANCQVTLTNVRGTGVLYFAKFDSGSSVTITGLTCTASGTNGRGLWFSACLNITANNLSISNTQGAGVYIEDTTNMSLIGDDWTLTNTNNATGYGGAFTYTGSSKAGVTMKLTNISITGSSCSGIRLTNGSVFTLDSKIDRFNISGCTTHGVQTLSAPNLQILNGTCTGNGQCGFYFETSPNIILYNDIASNNGMDGFSFGLATTTAHGTAGAHISHCIAYGNGTVDAIGYGDGFTAHEDCTGMYFGNCIAYSNKNSGLAMIDNSSGTILNCTFCYNGDSASTFMGVRGGFYSQSTGLWIVKNCIFSGNFPYEIHCSTSNPVIGLDYNQYYHVGNNCTETSFATLNNRTTALTWAGYHALYESNSKYGNPLFKETVTYTLSDSSPCIGAGIPYLSGDKSFIGAVPPKIGSITGDLDANGKVDFADFSLFAQHWLEGIVQ